MRRKERLDLSVHLDMEDICSHGVDDCAAAPAHELEWDIPGWKLGSQDEMMMTIYREDGTYTNELQQYYELDNDDAGCWWFCEHHARRLIPSLFPLPDLVILEDELCALAGVG